MKKIRLIHIVIFLAALPLILISCNPDSEEVDPDFQITLPETWSGYNYGNSGLVYAAGRDLVDPQDTIRELLYVVKEKLQGYALNTYYTALLPNIQDDDFYISQIYASDTVINTINFKKLISREILEYANPAYQDTFDLDVITDRYFFFENNTGYNMVFYSIDTIYFKRNRAVFNGIMNSFQYLK